MMEYDVSVVIPCKNEKETIAEVLSTVGRELQQGGFQYEIIVVDNGSTDGSDVIAKKNNVTVLYSTARTVAGVRNAGVDSSMGKLLVFLDADIVVQSTWGKYLRDVYDSLIKNNNVITGSHPTVPFNIKPLLASWYKAISEDVRDTHLGTGHMIVSANAFKRIGGFNTEFVTGEDYDLCSRAKKKGILVVSNPQLVVCHHGYPTNLLGFAKREIWHGEGDCASFKAFLTSSVALCGFLFLFLNVLGIIIFFVNLKLFLALFVVLFIITVSVNYLKFGYGDLRNFVFRSIVAYIYLVSRGMSLPFSVFNKSNRI